jgi:hypothetical protein
MLVDGVPLTAEDLAHLAASWITEELANQAGIFRVESYQGAELVGRKDGTAGQGKYSGIIFPNIAPGSSSPREYRLKRDNPDYETKNGETRAKNKYLSPPGARNQLYFVPGTSLDDLANTHLPVVITEGEKKVLAVHRLAQFDREVSDFLAVGVTGVWNWKGTIGKGTEPNGQRIDLKGVIPDFGLIDWNGRTVYIVFDADFRTNESVFWARKMLARELATRGARVMFIDIPVDAGVKAIDDLLVAWSPFQVRQLFETATIASATLKQLPHNYAEKNGRLVRYKPNKDVIEEIALTNFTAKIIADIQEDDGAESRRFFQLAVSLYGHANLVVMPVSKLQSMDFHLEHLGPDAVVFPNQKEYARTAIQMLSLDIQRRRIFTHIGWRFINKSWVYLHGDGAIGGAGIIPNIDVRLSGGVSGYRLIVPSDGARKMKAILASRQLIEVAPPHIAFPAIAATYRAALKIADFTLWFVGATGVFKSELAALVQQHFGPSMNARHLPANFASTGNALELLAFLAKDAILVADDFAPHGSIQDIARYHAIAERLVRSGGNNQGRARLTSDVRLREPRPPRCLSVITGEDVPRGQSIRGRCLIIQVGPTDVNTLVLTECQKAAAAGLYAESMGGFVQYVAERYGDIQVRLEQQVVDLRDKASKAHARTPGIVAHLQAGFEFFTEYAVDAGAFSARYAAELNRRCWEALSMVAQQQATFQGAAEPARHFIELLRSAMNSGAAHVANIDGEIPRDRAVSWGWSDEGTETNHRWVGKGRRVGWVDGENLYLDPTASFAVAQELGGKTGEPLCVTQTVLNKRCFEAGLLLSCDKERARGTLTIRKTVQGTKVPVLHLSSKVLTGADGKLGDSVSPVSRLKQETDLEMANEVNEFQGNVGNVSETLGGESPGKSNPNASEPFDLFQGVETKEFDL